MAATGKPRLNVKRTVAELEAELEKRTAERDEALSRETATAEVLQVINASPGDLAPVFDAMLEKAIRLCGATYGHFRTYDGERFPLAAVRGEPSLVAIHRHHSTLQLGPNHPIGRFLQGEDVIHIADAAAIPAYRSDPAWRDLVDTGACRSVLAVALRRDRTLLGYLNVYRSEVRPFSDKEIALLQNFAAQAVIAMENARLLDELRTRTDDLEESLEYQTATSDVLEVISRSTFDLQPVLDTLVATAARLCNSHSSALTIREGDVYRYVATHSAAPGLDAFLRQRTFTAGRGTTTGRAALEGKVVHIPDVTADPEYDLPEITTMGNIRTTLSVPLLRNRVVIGTLNLAHERVEPFTERQIELVRTFADQAVIAIENARLIAETRKALEQQTATAEVLGVINSSPGDLVPVFDAMLDKALALCGAAFGVLWIYDGQSMRATAIRGATPEYARFLGRQAHPVAPGGVHERLRAGEDAVHIPDLVDTDDYRSGNPLPRAFVELGGGRGLLAVALRKEERFLGNLAIYRSEVRPFTDKQVALLQNFAAQAVIAMENARLITETREALEQQTATAEVLAVINSSPGDLTPVFDAILEKANYLCETVFGVLWTFDGTHFLPGAIHGPQAFIDAIKDKPRAPTGGGTLHRHAAGEQLVHIEDMAAETGVYETNSTRRVFVDLGGGRSALSVALSKDDRLLGAIQVYRQEVRPFTDKQVALLQNFAAQAVIAMENARLLTETREALEQQTATTEVLQVINSSPGDLTPVFDDILSKATRLCDAEFGVFWSYDGKHARAAALKNVPRAFAEAIAAPFQPLGDGPFARLIAGDPVAQVLDPANSQRGRAEVSPLRRAYLELGGPRTVLFVALRKEDALLGALMLYRPVVRGFSEKQVAVVANFAAQAVIAIENARLITETREARDGAEHALRDLKAAQANLIQAEKMASLGQLTAGIAHEIKNPLNFVNNFAGLSVELLDELKETAGPALAALDEDQRAELDETMEMLSGNLQKIGEHGRRADNIVKSMLEHSRGVSGERREIDVNGLIDEALNLAYHGARAQDQGFNITLERDYAATLPQIELAPQEMTRVFLNLFGNGFYAANKRARENGGGSFRPVLSVATRDLGEIVEVKVRDNGTGIPPDIRDKLFQPFFTTKPTGEGTGLGLSISYDIVTQQHGGSIEVESRVGEFTEFTVRLPRHP